MEETPDLMTDVIVLITVVAMMHLSLMGTSAPMFVRMCVYCRIHWLFVKYKVIYIICV